MITTSNSPNGALKNGTTIDGTWTVNGCAQGAGNLILKLSASNPTLCLAQQSGPVSLAPGAKAIIYFKVPQNILTTVDAGSTSSVALYAGSVGSPQSVTVESK